MLIASLLGLLIGPILFHYFKERAHFYDALDGFIVVVITGIVLMEVVPDAVAAGAYSSFLFLALGVIGPTLLERFFHTAEKAVHRGTLLIGILGLFLHALVDGAALLAEHDAGANLLSFGIVLHRLPVGLTLWWLIVPRYGQRMAMLALAFMMASTLIGYGYGQYLLSHLSESGLLWFQALVAGSILHVVFHRPHLEHSRMPRSLWPERFGNVAGFALLAFIILAGIEHAHAHAHAPHEEGTLSTTFLMLFVESAPALLLAYTLGGLVSEFLPKASILWMQKGNRGVQALKGMAVGLPLPICTCGVLPLYQSIIKKGAPASASMAFLIATPELGLDALILSFPLLGAEMTFARLVAAGLLALLVGWLVGRMVQPQDTGDVLSVPESPKEELMPRIRKSLKTGFGPLVDDTAPWILMGIFVAALAQPVLSAAWLQQMNPILEVLLFALLGIPVYVCASGATPIVAILLLGGVSPGAALAFLLTGPATNISTFGVLRKLHGGRIAVTFALVTTGITLLLALSVNLFWSDMQLLSTSEFGLEYTTVFQWICAGGLLLLMMFSVLKQGARGFMAEVFNEMRLSHHHHHDDHEHHLGDHTHDGECTSCSCIQPLKAHADQSVDVRT